MLPLVILSAALVNVEPGGAVPGPLEALAKVRELRSSGAVAADETVEVRFAEGTYSIDRTLEIGAAEAPVAFVGPESGRASICGGRRLGPFEVGSDGLWRCRVTDGLAFEQLWVNGVRAVRARSPNKFYHYIRESAGEEENPATGKVVDMGRRVFFSDSKSLDCLARTPADELKDIVIHVWWSWDDEYRRLASADPAAGRVELTADVERDFFQWGTWCPRFTIENCRAALDAPGEWFLDRREGVLLYKPRKHERPDSVCAVAPTVTRIVSVTNATKVGFLRLSFAHNGWTLPVAGLYPYQSAYFADAAIVVRDSERVVFKDCRVEHTADYGIWFDRGTRKSSVRHTYFGDLGAGGVRIGSRGWDEKNPEDGLVHDVTVDDNIITSGGHVFPAGTGVFLTFARNCRVTHNEICDLYYSGICCGYRWGYYPAPNRDNEISWNHIHHLGKGVLSDMGFIYTLADSRGTVIAGNHGHDIFSYGYTGSGGTGLYADEGSRGILWTSNLIHHTKTSALNLHYGMDNRFINNIFAFPTKPGTSVAGRWRAEGHTSLICSNNVFVWSGACKAWSGPSGRVSPVSDLVFGSNLWWSPDPVAADAFNGGSWEEWLTRGMDGGSVLADPRFRDWKRGDWRLDRNSPAFGIGFREWDYTLAGVRKDDRDWRKRAESVSPAKYEIPPEPPRYPGKRSYRTGFETRAPGTFPYGVFDYVGIGREFGYVRETADCARTGKQSLELHDFADLKPAYLPHVFKSFRISSDLFVLGFSIRCDELAKCEFLFREYTKKAANGEYACGPWMYVEDGKLGVRCRTAEGGKTVQSVEFPNYAPGKWVDVEFTFHRTDGVVRTWDFSVTDEDGKAVERKGLLCADAEFESPTWIGYDSSAAYETVTYIDDFHYENK